MIGGLPISATLRFTDGAVIGSKEFVNDAFAGARERFTERRKDGARRMGGSGAPWADTEVKPSLHHIMRGGSASISIRWGEGTNDVECLEGGDR
jgi:hypothetical protein